MPKIIYDEIPEFGQFVEYIIQADPTIEVGKKFYGVKIKRVSLSELIGDDETESIEQVLDTLSKDYEKVSRLREISGMFESEADKVKVRLQKKFHSDVADYAMQDLNPASVVNKLKEVVSYPEWAAQVFVEVGDVYMYDKNLYEVIQAHTTQSDWTPPVTRSLWKRFYEPSDDPWPWVQPTGAHDAYPLGARVEYNGNIYESTIDANVWAPDVTGWKNLTAGESDVWEDGVSYSVGDEVTHNEKHYRCLQAHTAQVGWEPPNTPALWEAI